MGLSSSALRSYLPSKATEEVQKFWKTETTGIELPQNSFRLINANNHFSGFSLQREILCFNLLEPVGLRRVAIRGPNWRRTGARKLKVTRFLLLSETPLRLLHQFTSVRQAAATRGNKYSNYHSAQIVFVCHFISWFVCTSHFQELPFNFCLWGL